MLNKLMKYDFKSLFRSLIPMYLILFLLGLLNRFGNFIQSKLPILSIPAGFITTMYFIVIIAIPIVTFIITILKFYNNLTKDEGYLMHTLPVKKSSLILSKLITGIIAMVTSIIISIIGLLIGSYDIYFNAKFISIAFDILIKINSFMPIGLFIVSMGLSVILQQLLIYASISLGQMHSNNKLIYAFIYGVIIYNVTQAVTGLIILIPTILNDNFMKAMNSNTPPFNILNEFLLGSCILTLLIIIAYFVLTTKAMEKKLNLE